MKSIEWLVHIFGFAFAALAVAAVVCGIHLFWLLSALCGVAYVLGIVWTKDKDSGLIGFIVGTASIIFLVLFFFQ